MTGDRKQGVPPAAADWNLAEIADGLFRAREDWRAEHRRHAEHGQAGFPSRRKLEAILSDLSGALFPLRLGPHSVREDNEADYVVETLDRALTALREQVRLELGYDRADQGPETDRTAGRIVGAFARELPGIRRLLDTDVEAAYAGDPAARSVDEVLICYPCIQAVIHYRLAHSLYRLGAPLVARIVAEIAHSLTGIDIHPGASIGHSFFIDHGSGVVIGETAVVGDRVRIYQAVTLGARSFPSEEDGSLTKGMPRHPIVEDDVVIYAGATILGRVTVGAGAVIGGNVWLTESVPPGSVIHQAFAERERAAASTVPTGHVVEAADPDAPRGWI
ncbi:MAG: serine O-acetyltransferase EpsC [Sphingomonas sp.]